MSELEFLLGCMELEKKLRESHCRFACFGFAGVNQDCHESCVIGVICAKYRKLMAKEEVHRNWYKNNPDKKPAQVLLEKERDES